MIDNETDETFFSRWSRRKARVRQEDAPPAPPRTEDEPDPATAATPLAGMAAVTTVESPDAAPRPDTDDPPAARAVPPPTLDEVQHLTPASDFSRFVAPDVDSGVRNAAMKKLFTDPHFNVMDGLDTYIDDYGRADPIPKSMLRQMLQARMLGLLDDEIEEQPKPAGGVVQAELQTAEGVDPTASAAGDADPPESVPELLSGPARVDAAHDLAVLAPAPPPVERTAGVTEPPVA